MARNRIKNTKIHETRGDQIVDIITSVILLLVAIIVLYPIIYVISCSFSSSSALSKGLVVLWPVDFSLEAYEFVLAYKDVWVGFRNSIFYCFMDVMFQTFCTIMMAYPLSRRYLQGRKFYTIFFYLTTRIGAGLIPCFIQKCNMGLFDNVWAVLISGTIAVSDMLMLRAAINSAIPGELHDAAMIDGASHFQTVFKLVVPLTKATLSVLILYSIVGQWNEYFTSMIYLRDKRYYPLQLVLRPIMTAASMVGQLDAEAISQSSYHDQAQQGLENVRYALIIISSTPIIVAYFFVQKYFKGGLMVGSVKG